MAAAHPPRAPGGRERALDVGLGAIVSELDVCSICQGLPIRNERRVCRSVLTTHLHFTSGVHDGNGPDAMAATSYRWRLIN